MNNIHLDQLNLSIEPQTLDQVIAMGSPMALSAFGKFARYLFVMAIQNYALKTGNMNALDTIKKYVDKTFETIDKPVVARIGKGFPKTVLARQTSLDAESLFEVYGADIRRWYRNYVKENLDFTKGEKDLFSRAMSFAASGKDTTSSAIKTSERIAWMVSPSLGKLYNDIVRLQEGAGKIPSSSIKDLYDIARANVRILSGRASLVVTPRISEKAKTDPRLAEALKEYRATMRKIKDNFDVILKKETFDGPLPVDKLESIMKRKGFETMFFPTQKNGFRGSVGILNGKMTLFTEAGLPINGLIAPGAKIVMNKAYDPKLDNTNVLQYTAPNAVTTTRVYTMQYKGRSDTKKFTGVEDNMSNVNRWVSAWRRDLKSKDLMRKVPAVVAYLLYSTGARVGSRTESASLKGAATTYGISTLRVKHCKVSPTSIILAYNGKKGQAQRHVLRLKDDPYYKICAATLKMLMRNKDKDDLLFEFVRPKSTTGALQQVNPTFFKKYMQSVGYNLKVHNLRHIKGTSLVRELLTSTPWVEPKGVTLVKRQASADDYIKTKILTKAGNLLGHKATRGGKTVTAWRTSMQSYINPQPIIDWYKQHRLTLPNWVPTKMDASE